MKRTQEQKFDDQLRQSLGEFKPSHRPGSWEELSSKLEEAELPFDAAVREGLAPLAATLSPQAWEQLEARIDEVRTKAADKVVQERLVSAESFHGYVSGWASLAAQLELIAYRRQSLAALKLTEICLALSLLLLFWRFAPVGEQEVLALASPTQVEETTPLTSFDDNTLPSRALAQVHAARETAIAEPTNIEPERVGSISASTDNLLAPSVNQEFPVGPIGKSALEAATVSNALSFDLLAARADVNHPLIASRLIAAYRSESNPNPAANLLEIKVKNPIQTHLRAFYSPVDLNQVITPENAFFNRVIQRDNRLTYGVSAGILLDFTSNKYTVQTGLIYGLRSYIPTLLKVADSEPLPSPIAVNRSGYSNLEFHTVSVPLTVNRTLVDNGRWRISAGAGVGLNMILNSSFTKFEGADQVLNDLLNSGAEGRGFQDRVDAREYFNPEAGWLQGGSIFSNANFYMIGTASFERRVSDRLSIYAAPTINRSFHFVKKGGVGPNFDRIHNHSIQIGARIRLGAEK